MEMIATIGSGLVAVACLRDDHPGEEGGYDAAKVAIYAEFAQSYIAQPKMVRGLFFASRSQTRSDIT
jgi:hypothetical protein